MQPMKLLASVIVGLPASVFLLTLILTEGAPFKPLAPGEGSGPAAATRTLPQTTLEGSKIERGGAVAAAGHSVEYADITGELALGRKLSPPEAAEPARLINHDRDAKLFITLFGTPYGE